MWTAAFKLTISGMGQIFLLAAIGYFLVKKQILRPEGLDALSRLVIEVSLPLLIFCQLVKDFSFQLYPHWWFFPLLSLLINLAGFLVAALFLGLIKGTQQRIQFLSLVTFQNSGYLPLALIAALLPPEKANPLLIYLFLFLMGFNLAIWSIGVYMLTFQAAKKFELGSLFSPPVIAAIFSLLFIFFGGNKLVFPGLLRPLGLVGSCTLPLAMLVVGGNLAQIKLRHIDYRAMLLVILAKLILLPLLGLWLVLKFGLTPLLGLFILMQLAVPPATSLSVISRHYQKEDLLVSQGIFFGHLASLITLPLFLSLYFARVMIQ